MLRGLFVGAIAALALIGIGLVLTGTRKLHAQPQAPQISRVLCGNLLDEQSFSAQMRAAALRHIRSDAVAALTLREIDHHAHALGALRKAHC